MNHELFFITTNNYERNNTKKIFVNKVKKATWNGGW